MLFIFIFYQISEVFDCFIDMTDFFIKPKTGPISVWKSEKKYLSCLYSGSFESLYLLGKKIFCFKLSAENFLFKKIIPFPKSRFCDYIQNNIIIIFNYIEWFVNSFFLLNFSDSFVDHFPHQMCQFVSWGKFSLMKKWNNIEVRVILVGQGV
jgi:hypothetical protein